MKPIRAVFFDAGHTLIYAHPSRGELYAEESARFGTRIDPARFEDVFPAVFAEFVREYTADPAHGPASDEQDEAMWREIVFRVHARMPELAGIDRESWFRRLYIRFGEAGAWRFYPDAIPSLRELRARGLKLGVVSNWDRRLRRIAEETGLSAHVDFLVLSSETGFRKPDRAIFDEALRRAGVAAEEAVHVGDLYEEDVIGAQRAGLCAVLLDRDRRGAAKIPESVPVIGSLEDLAGRLGEVRCT